jgi:hypothetical protein
MKTVIIVSKCSRVIKLKQSEIWYQFQFKGVYSGQEIKKVLLRSKVVDHVILGEEYLMYVQLLSCSAGLIKGEILKLRKINECWDRS